MTTQKVPAMSSATTKMGLRELKIVDVNIRRLRLKIEDNAQNPTYINTVWGYGYKWGF